MNLDAFIGVWILRRKHLRACANRWMRILVCSALSVRSRKALYKNETAPLPPSLFIDPHPRHANVSQSSWPANVHSLSQSELVSTSLSSRHCIASFLETWDCLVVKIPNQIIYQPGNFLYQNGSFQFLFPLRLKVYSSFDQLPQVKAQELFNEAVWESISALILMGLCS